jgi:acyl-CoA dehydrogenase
MPAPSSAVGSALSEEERLVQATAREFARRELAPGAAERDEQERYDRSLFARMGELGLTAVPLPEDVGGHGFSYRAWTLAMEEVAYADMAMAVSLSVHVLCPYPIVTWGSAEQKARWLPAMLGGEEMGAFALTEPQAGSDAAALRLTAERVGPADEPTAYRLTGTKIWITNAIEAERYLVFATVDPAAGTKGVTVSWSRRARRASVSAAPSASWASVPTPRQS